MEKSALEKAEVSKSSAVYKAKRILRINFDKMTDELVDDMPKKGKRKSRKSQIASSGLLEIVPDVPPVNGKRGRGRPKGSANKKTSYVPAASAPTENAATASMGCHQVTGTENSIAAEPKKRGRKSKKKSDEGEADPSNKDEPAEASAANPECNKE